MNYTFSDYINAGFPCLNMITHEYQRAEQCIKVAGKWQTFTWDCLQGIRKSGRREIVDELINPVDAVNWLADKRDIVLVCQNLHLFLNNPEVAQAILNIVQSCKSFGNTLICLSPGAALPAELQNVFVVVDLPLPDEKELAELQAELGEVTHTKTNKKAARAAKGLSEFQAEGAFALSLSQKRYFSARTVAKMKEQIIRKSGLLECFEPCSIKEVGGLQPLKDFITSRASAFNPSSNLPPIKSMLLLGVPGTGKSLCCKAVSSILGWPLIRLDIGALKGSLVGQSEKNMREATKTVTAFGECVVWIDEIEKSFTGVSSSGFTDGGSTSGMFSHFLTWMQENRSPVLIMATANRLDSLPPEFLRAGRFDKIWFVDLPTLPERKEIVKIMNKRYGTGISLSRAEQLSGYSGAEIEAVIKGSLFTDFETALSETVPLSRLMRNEIEQLRKWAEPRCQKANTPENLSEPLRKIRKAPISEAQ